MLAVLEIAAAIAVHGSRWHLRGRTSFGTLRGAGLTFRAYSLTFQLMPSSDVLQETSWTLVPGRLKQLPRFSPGVSLLLIDAKIEIGLTNLFPLRVRIVGVRSDRTHHLWT